MSNEIHETVATKPLMAVQKSMLFTELKSSIGFQFLAICPTYENNREDIIKRLKDNAAVRVKLERVRHSVIPKSMVSLDKQSPFLIFFPEGSFCFITTNWLRVGLPLKDFHLEPASFGKTYLGALRYELCRNEDHKSAKKHPFLIREILADKTGNTIHCLRSSPRDAGAPKTFEKVIEQDLENTIRNPVSELTSVQEDVSRAHLIVCKDIFRKTMLHLERYAENDSVEERQHFLNLANEEFALERQNGKKQKHSSHRLVRNARRRVQKYNKVDREIVTNWESFYQDKDGATFALLIHEATGVQFTPKALRTRRERLGLTTHQSVKTGPKPKL